jgi:hypothetical protein
MATANIPHDQGPGIDTIRDAWLSRLNGLVGEVEGWARELGWSTRRIEKKLEDHEIGLHKVPALLLQEETVRVLLDPIARSSPGAEGIVDLYLMPGFDDIASLYFLEDGWHLHYMFPGSPTVASIREADSMPLSKETFEAVLDAMLRHAR